MYGSVTQDFWHIAYTPWIQQQFLGALSSSGVVYKHGLHALEGFSKIQLLIVTGPSPGRFS